MGAKVLFIQALTPLHIGVGRGEGAHVDLPVQRDEFGLPTIWASSLKGALKDHAKSRDKSQDKKATLCVFGRDPGGSGYDTSAAALLDAKLLLAPARSLRGVWLYVTSPHMLRTFLLYLESLNFQGLVRQAAEGLLQKAQGLSSRTALISSSNYLDAKGRMTINEIEYSGTVEQAAQNFLKALSQYVPSLAGVASAGLAVVSDDDVVGLVNRSMLVQYRVALNPETKTVKEGPWSEEYVPQFALFVSGVVFKDRSCMEKKASDLFVELVFDGKKEAGVWVGGKETIGKGLVKLYLAP